MTDNNRDAHEGDLNGSSEKRSLNNLIVRARSVDWPPCPVCGSDDTSVVPETKEWTCQSCGFQWTTQELEDASEDHDKIPNLIEEMEHRLDDEPVQGRQ